MIQSNQEKEITNNNASPNDQQVIPLPTDNLVQLLFSLPPSLLSFLVICSKPIYLISQLSLIIQWSHPLGPYPSWILLFTFSAFVLISPFLLCYAIPNLIVLTILSINLLRKNQEQQNPNKNTPPPLKSSASSHPIAVLDSLQSFQIIVNHYSKISSRLEPIYQLVTCSDPPRSIQALKTCLTSIPFSILITYFVPPQTVILTLGSILIVWSAEWFQLSIRLLWKSLFIRLLVTLLVDICLYARFHPIAQLHRLDPSLQSRQSTQLFYSTLSYIRSLFKFNSSNLGCRQTPSGDQLDADYSVDHSQGIEFCLTIFENQRWWMGLDWTPNLLPHERPNWSDSLNHSVPSPASITLPSPKVFKDPTQDSQRRVEWKWIDSDWKIIEAHSTNNTSKEEDHPAQVDEALKTSAITTDRSIVTSLCHTPPRSPSASFRRHQNKSSTSHSGSSACLSACLDSEIIDESLRTSGLNTNIIGAHDPAKPWDVDDNGWQYGDNHWEKMSKKSGIGKYTRRRAWARKACLVTRLEPLGSCPSSENPVPADSAVDSPLLPQFTIPAPDSDSDATLLPQFPSPSSQISSASSFSTVKSKKSFGLLRRKK